MIQFLVTTLYLFWTVWVFSVTSKWSYPFMEKIPLPIFPIFCAINLMIYVAFYYVGKLLCYFRWRGKGMILLLTVVINTYCSAILFAERHQLMNKLGK